MKRRIAILSVLALLAALVPGMGTAHAQLEDPPELLLQWGEYGSGNGQFNIAADVEVGPNGLVYVLDGSNHRVQVFDPDGNLQFAWGSYGSGDGQFRHPDGIAFDVRDGFESVYVMEYSGHRVQKFELDGEFILKFGYGGSGEGEFIQPSGGAVDAAGNVYVADRVNHRIQVFNDQGLFLRMWGWGVATGANQLEVCTNGCRRGIDGHNPGQFIYPTGVAFDSAGDVYVAGHWRHAVHKYRTDGTFIDEWSTDPHGPVGIAIDPDDNVYTVAWNQGNVYKQTTAGDLLTQWGGFDRSNGVATDGEGHVYVTDTNRHRVMKYGPANEPPDCSAAFPDIELSWPPNHKFVPIEVLGVADPDSDPVTITIESIFQDELVDSTGDGAFAPDGQGVGTSIAEVRAERDGGGNGRVYHISFTADDGQGGQCSGEVLVGVPKNLGKKGAPVDNGALFDSTVIPAPVECNGSAEFEGHYYALVDAGSDLLWHDAKDAAELLSCIVVEMDDSVSELFGHLATVTPPEYPTVIGLASSWTKAWVGARFHQDVGAWQWITGEVLPMDDPNWPPVPWVEQDDPLTDPVQDVVLLDYAGGTSLWEGWWSWHNDRAQRSFVVEFEPPL